MDFSTSIKEIPNIGEAYQKRLQKLGINNLKDLFYHFPHRYDDFSNIIPISELKTNQSGCVKGEIMEIKNIRTRKRGLMLTEALISDDSSSIKCLWFNQPFIKETLKKGQYVCLAGKLTSSKNGIYLSNPVYEKIRNLEIKPFDKRLTHAGRLIPVYPETAKLTSRWLRYIIKPNLERLKNINDPLPDSLIKKYNFLSLSSALNNIHFPQSSELVEKAKKRFAFQELFFLGVFVLKQRIKRLKEKSISFPIKLGLIKELVKSFPFSLTDSQRKAVWQILKDLEKERPMSRLLQGDVGSGKTIVAALAAFNVAKFGYQVAFMAPTEILAKQHFETIRKFFKNSELHIGLMTAKNSSIFFKRKSKVSKKRMLERIGKGEIDVLIGTHSLIQDKVNFKKLGLVIVDEQHRFGVEQRSRLVKVSNGEIKYIPHLLSMTATPIPRTLALTIYGDLDLSILDEMPKGERKIETKVVSTDKRKEIYSLIKKEIKKGRQVFVVCPRIEKKEDFQLKKNNWSEAKAVEEEYEKLSKEIFPELKIGMLHGKMKAEEKEKTMKKFKGKKINILVSTSVIEVGIDIPNATVMMVEGAERFGLAQLHQFRGRIGRKGDKSYFLLFPEAKSKRAYQRLNALIKTNDGLKLAEADLKIRGAGEFMGTRQWGIPDLVMASLSDLNLIEKTRNAAKELLERDPLLKKHPLLIEELKKFTSEVHLE